MKYAVFVRTEGSADIFLQSSNELDRVRRDQNSIRRWMTEMGVSISNPANSKFVLTENGVPILERTLLGTASRSWVPIKSQNLVKA